MAAVIVPKNSAANAVPDDASIPPNFHPYIKVTVEEECKTDDCATNHEKSNHTKTVSFKAKSILDFENTTTTQMSIVTKMGPHDSPLVSISTILAYLVT